MAENIRNKENKENIETNKVSEQQVAQQSGAQATAAPVQSAVYQIAAELPWQAAEEGIRRKIMGYDTTLMLVQVEFKSGAVSTPHAHPHAQATYVVSGKFKVMIGKEEKILSAGDGFYIPSQVWHGATCLESGTLIDSFSPFRADFM